MVKFDVVFQDMVTVLHVEMIDRVFSVSGRIHRTELSAEGAKGVDECGIVVYPVWEFIRVKKRRFKIF